jgi:hypothetical protein
MRNKTIGKFLTRKPLFLVTAFLAVFWVVPVLLLPETAQAVSLPDFSKTSDLPAFISSVYSFALTVVGLAVFVRILYAGFLWLTAAGNASQTSKATTMITNAVVGAIILFAAYLILHVINPDLVKNTFNFTIPAG